MCESFCMFGGGYVDGQRVFCTTSCPFWGFYFIAVFYVLLFMIVTSSWINGVISTCYPDTFYLYFLPHLLKQPFFYNAVAFIANTITRNKHQTIVDFAKMFLFDGGYTMIVVATVFNDLWNIDQG
eukprot:392152_1